MGMRLRVLLTAEEDRTLRDTAMSNDRRSES